MFKQKIKKYYLWCLPVVLVLLAVWGYGVYISYHNPVVREYLIASEKLTEPVTFVLLADLHDNVYGADNAELVELVLAQEPDAILLAGDFINKYSTDIEGFLSLVRQLAAERPVYFAWGNHELRYVENTEDMDVLNSDTKSALEQSITAAGAVLLERTWKDVEIGGQTIRIGGMYEYAFAQDGKDSVNPEKMEPQVYQFLTDFTQEKEVFKLMICHRPDSFVLGEASKAWDVDLVVSGHLHGGQVVLPFLGGVFGGDQGFFPEYVHGLYEKDLVQVLITNGLGSASHKVVPRFNNVPEIVVIKLVPA